jgi:hypothetical protein
MTWVAVHGKDRTSLLLEKLELVGRLREQGAGAEQENRESHITQ